MPKASGYRLTADLVAAHGGGPVVCLAATAIGQVFAGFTEKPGAQFNQSLTADSAWSSGVYGLDIVEPAPAEPQPPAPVVVRVEIAGPIAQRCEPRGDCSAFVEGHDNIAEKMIAALEVGDVLLCFDTPGGAYAGGQQAIASILAAKAQHGRHITGWVDELCASMGAWYAYALCDEIFLPIAGAIGSIGARSAHGSVAGALAQAGVAVTFACWPDEGKIAGVAELPLSDLGKSRMDRGVDEAGEQFCAALVASPYGIRHGFTREFIVGLRADCLSGANAVAAGLADGVASFAEVQSYALALSAGGQDMPGLVAGDEDPKKKDAPPAKDGDAKDADPKPTEEGEQPSSVCKSCNMQQRPEAKFCDQCNASMAAEPTDDAPDSDRKPGAAAPVTPPAAMSATASLASILGATGETPLALKTAAIQLRQIADTARGVTGQIVPAAIVGSLLSMPSRLDAAAQVIADRKTEQAAKVKSDKAAKAKADNTERLALCKRGIATGAPEMSRGRVYTDKVNAAGVREGVVLTAMFAEMNLDTLRAHVEGLESSAPKPNPFEPDREAAKAASGAADAPQTFTAAERKRLESHPTAQMLLNRGSALTSDKIVDAIIIRDPKSARAFLAQNGAAA